MTVIDEIKDRLDIVEVVGTYVQLKKAGRSYKGLCPFHNEKTPSFVVFPDSQNWRCFGACGTGGDMFTFVMKRENVDFGDALTLLAARAGVEIKPQSETASAEEGRLERLRAIQADAAAYFNYLLSKSEEATLARQYLERRGLTRETWETWQLGYSLDSWDALKNRLQGKGYTPQELEEAGVVIRKEEIGSYYDRFRGRLMIPIRDGQGRTIGFGARILREDAVGSAHAAHPGPKYMNSPQTPLFDKGNVLYGLDMAKKAIRDANLAVIVEGYMDVLMSHQVGVTNVVAGMGTALTEAQMRQIKRYTSNVTLALDPDLAGEHAAARGLEAARQSLARDWEPVFSPTGLLRHESRLKAQLRIAALPDGLDPDELAYRDVEQWRQVIREARPIVDYYLAQAQREEDLRTAQGKAQAIDRLAPLIQEIANPIERTHYVQALARLVQMDERLVTQQVARESRIEERSAAEPKPSRQPVAQAGPKRAAVVWSFGPEEYILGWLTLRPELLAGLDDEMIGQQAPPLSPDDLTSAENQALLAALLALPPQGGRPVEERLAELPEALAPAAQSMVAEVRGRPPLTDEKLVKDLVDSLLRIRERNLKRQVQQLEFLIRESTGAEDRDESRRLHELMTSYTAQKRHIQKLLSMRSIAGVLAQRKPIGDA